MTVNTKTDKKEFKELTYPHMKLVYNVALRYCSNSLVEAEDIVQETYLLAFKNFNQLRDKSKCRPWLLKILRNNFLKTYHKLKNQQKLSEKEYGEFLEANLTEGSIDAMLLKKINRQIVQQTIDQLPLKYKEVLVLFYMDEMLYKDIADSLDLPIGTVMSRLARAREGFRMILLKQMNSKKNDKLLTPDLNHFLIPA